MNCRGGPWWPPRPEWATEDSAGRPQRGFGQHTVDSYTRAVLTAEAFIVMFEALGPFDPPAFLRACGLVGR
jgi:hypothetical protein